MHLPAFIRMIWNGYEVLIKQDMKLQMKLSEALKRQKAISTELVKASNAKTEFLSRMSHDIRTPMKAILGMAQLAKNELQHTEIVKDYLDKLDSSGRFLMGLLNDVLDISMIEQNAVDLHPEPFRLEEFRQQVENLFVPQCIQKDIEFTFNKENVRYESLMLDKLRFNQIIFNLLNNAVRYTPRGGRTCTSHFPGKNGRRPVQMAEAPGWDWQSSIHLWN